LTAAEGDDERVIDGADSSASFVGIVAASTSTCRSPYERGHPQVVTSGSAAAPLPLLGAARLRCGSACPDRSGRLARRAVAGCRHGDGADHQVRHRQLSTVRRHGRCRTVVIGSGGEHLRATSAPGRISSLHTAVYRPRGRPSAAASGVSRCAVRCGPPSRSCVAVRPCCRAPPIDCPPTSEIRPWHRA
jgi:hypothetical protein